MKEAINYEKKDCALLIVCNGGECTDESLLPTGLAFSEIERLYKDMLSIKFNKAKIGESCSKQGALTIVINPLTQRSIIDRLPLLSLEEIKEAFPSSITDSLLKKMDKSLEKYVAPIYELKRQIVDKVFKGDEKKLYALEQELEFSFTQKILHPFYYRNYKQIKDFIECKNLIHNSTDSVSREILEKHINKLDKPKREELIRQLSAIIDNEFHELAEKFLDYDNKKYASENDTKIGIKDKKKEISGQLFDHDMDFKEFRWYQKLWHPTYYKNSLEIKSFEACEEALRKSVAVGSDELFFQAIEDIKKHSTSMLGFQLNKELFDAIYKLRHDTPIDCERKMISFKTLAEGFISRRKKYINDYRISDEARRENKEHILVNSELAAEHINNQKLMVEIEKGSEELRARADKAEARVEEVETRVEEERKAKEEERKAKEEERRAREWAEAKVKAVELLYNDADDQEISFKKIKNNNMKEFLEQQYTFLVLCMGDKIKYQELCCQYEDFKKEVDNERIRGNAIINKLVEFVDKTNRLDKEFSEKTEKIGRNIPECVDQDVKRLGSDIVERAINAKEEVERERNILKDQKQSVEEMVIQRQQEGPSSEISNASLVQRKMYGSAEKLH